MQIQNKQLKLLVISVLPHILVLVASSPSSRKATLFSFISFQGHVQQHMFLIVFLLPERASLSSFKNRSSGALLRVSLNIVLKKLGRVSEALP